MGWQTRRNSDYSEAVTLVVVVVVVALLSPLAHFLSRVSAWDGDIAQSKGQTAGQRGVGQALRQAERVSASRAGNFPI